MSLVLAVFVIVSGQVRTFDAGYAAPDADTDDIGISVVDDSFVALTAAGLPETIRVSIAVPPFSSVTPPDRLVVSDLFRPPTLPFV